MSFSWHCFEVSNLLPEGWQDEVCDVARRRAVQKTLRPTSVTSRETNPTGVLVSTVEGRMINNHLPWLSQLYRREFCDLVTRCTTEDVTIAKNPQYAINLNVQVGHRMRYECHVDSVPLVGNLYCTTHCPGDGGELVIARNRNALGPEDVDSDCIVIYPNAGLFVVFDGRTNPHYVRPLDATNALRVVATMCFYTNTCPESTRPNDLETHLYGTD